MQGGIETLPSSVLQEILINRRLGAVDLARLESCLSMFRAPSGIVPCEAKSIAEAATHQSCQTHLVFENLPPCARLALLARCDGHWKQVLYFLECLLLMPGRSAPAGARSNVSAGFFSLQLLANLAPFLGLYYSGVSVYDAELQMFGNGITSCCNGGC
jgi:hypothetical protein